MLYSILLLMASVVFFIIFAVLNSPAGVTAAFAIIVVSVITLAIQTGRQTKKFK